MASVADYLSAKDPLTLDAANFLLAYKEEDIHVDYKQTIDIGSQLSFGELSKDIMAFANTLGGFLVFGVQDKPRAAIGLDEDVAEYLNDSNNILQRINRHLEPQITDLRAKAFAIDGSKIAVVMIPKSEGKTHVFSKDGEYEYPSGRKKMCYREGTFYVRRSGSNHLADSRDLDDVINRRIDQFRESILGKIAQVVSAPTETSVLVVRRDPDSKTDNAFVIENSEDAIAVKGLSFSISPQTPEEEVAAVSAICQGDPTKRPRAVTVWTWYADRMNITLSKSQLLDVFKFSLWADAPAFYWIVGLKRSEIRKVLIEAIRGRPSSVFATQMILVAMLLGKGAYNEAKRALGDYFERLKPSMQSFPAGAPKVTHGGVFRQAGQSLSRFKKQISGELQNIADEAKRTGKEPGAQKRNTAQRNDMYLYGQTDNYK